MADPCQPIPGDTLGRFSVDVTVQAPPIPVGKQGPPIHSAPKKLVADTGGRTVIPIENIKDWGLKLGPAQGTNFGPMFDVIGAEMVVPVSDYGGASAGIRTCSNIAVHTLGEKAFGGCDGLLGMDQFELSASRPRENDYWHSVSLCSSGAEDYDRVRS